MTPYVPLLSSIAGAATCVTLFAILRRLMRSDDAPEWLTSSPVAYATAFLLTVGFSLTLVTVGMAAARFTDHVVSAGLISLGAHLALWTIIRIVIPVAPYERAAATLPASTVTLSV